MLNRKFAKPEGPYLVEFEGIGNPKESWTSTYFVVPTDELMLIDAVHGWRIPMDPKELAIAWGADDQGPAGMIFSPGAPVTFGIVRRVGDWGD